MTNKNANFRAFALERSLVDAVLETAEERYGYKHTGIAAIRAAIAYFINPPSPQSTETAIQKSEPLMTTKNGTTNYTVYMHPATFRALTVLLNDARVPDNRSAMLVRGLRALAFLAVHGPSRDYIAMPAHELAECEKAYRDIFDEMES